MNIFSSDSILGRFLNWLADIVILNVLWLICCIPIFTIGTSTTALYYSLMIRQRRDEGYVHKNFFKSFKQNFKQSTIIWIILLVVGFILTLDFRIGLLFNSGDGSIIGKIMLFFSVILMIPYTFILTYIFPVQAKFENTIKNNLKNSLLMAVAHFGYTLIILAFTAIFVLLTFTSKIFIGVEILCGGSLFAFLTSNVFIMVFRKHLPDEFDDDKDAIGMM